MELALSQEALSFGPFDRSFGFASRSTRPSDFYNSLKQYATTVLAESGIFSVEGFQRLASDSGLQTNRRPPPSADSDETVISEEALTKYGQRRQWLIKLSEHRWGIHWVLKRRELMWNGPAGVDNQTAARLQKTAQRGKTPKPTPVQTASSKGKVVGGKGGGKAVLAGIAALATLVFIPSSGGGGRPSAYYAWALTAERLKNG